MVSYAQNFEDVTLARLFRGQATGFYVDVGAADPVVRSVTKHFYDRGWRGVNVEPNARPHQALVRARPRDVNLCVALGKERGSLSFFEFEAEEVSTLDPEFARHFTDQGYTCTRRAVEVVTLREVCQAHCHGPIDFLKVDVEGWELPVLEGGDWSRYRPRVLVVEATKPESSEPNWQGWEPFILSQDYLFAHFDGLNRFYLAREERALLDRFPSPLRVFVRSLPRRAMAAAARLLRPLAPGR